MASLPSSWFLVYEFIYLFFVPPINIIPPFMLFIEVRIKHTWLIKIYE